MRRRRAATATATRPYDARRVAPHILGPASNILRSNFTHYYLSIGPFVYQLVFPSLCSCSSCDCLCHMACHVPCYSCLLSVTCTVAWPLPLWAVGSLLADSHSQKRSPALFALLFAVHGSRPRLPFTCCARETPRCSLLSFSMSLSSSLLPVSRSSGLEPVFHFNLSLSGFLFLSIFQCSIQLSCLRNLCARAESPSFQSCP